MTKDIDHADAWGYLGNRIENACIGLNTLIAEARDEGMDSEVDRLKAKLEGVMLVKSYWKEYARG